MTNQRRQRLRIEMTDWEGSTRFAEYDNFGIGAVSGSRVLYPNFLLDS